MSRLRFRRGLMLELHLKERNTVVQSEIYFEHFREHPNVDLGSEYRPRLNLGSTWALIPIVVLKMNK